MSVQVIYLKDFLKGFCYKNQRIIGNLLVAFYYQEENGFKNQETVNKPLCAR
jgi:hypothetical protein